jgi:predicted permease
MGRVREILWRISAVFRSRRLDEESQAEMRVHLELEIDAGMRRGLGRAEAERAARIRLGAVPVAIERIRDQRGLGWLDGTLTDLRHAFKALRRHPGFTLVAVAALSSAVAVNTLIFTIVYGVLLRPLPYPEPERLVRVYEWTPRNPKFPVSILNYLEDRRESTTLESIALYTGDDVQIMHGESAERAPAVRVTDNFLPLLGAQPMLGRNFLPSEMTDSAHVAILSHRLWTTRFLRDPEVVGKSVRLNREPWTIIGVLPPRFEHVGGAYRSPLQGDTVALWLPLGLNLRPEALRYWHFTNAVARLRPGFSLNAAQEDLNRIMDELKRRFPDAYGNARARVEPLAAEVVGGSKQTVKMLVAAGTLVWLIACVNIAGLCIARAFARRRELAVRQALGAGGWRLVRAVLSESLILGAAGGIFGFALAAGMLPVFRLILPVDFPRLHEIRLSLPGVAFAVATALLASIIAGLVPALRQTRLDPRGALSDESPASSAARATQRIRGALVVCEVALACVLCFGTVLLVRSSLLLGSRDQGFTPDRVLTLKLSIPRNAYPKPELVVAFYDELLRRWKEIPKVRFAGLATNIPWTGYDENTSFDILGRQRRPGESVQARFQAATPGYFDALKFRLLEGRLIEERDKADAPPIVIVNKELVRRYIPDGRAVGSELDIWDTKVRVVGIVADVCDGPSDPQAEPAFWWPMAQHPFGEVLAVLRTDEDPLSLAAPAADAVRSLDRELPVAAIRSMDDVAGLALAERRFTLLLFQAFAGLAVALAALGIYGLLAYMVQQRRRELGIRVALGATRAQIVAAVVRNGVMLGALGTGIGIALAPVCGRALSTMLYGVTATDAATLLIAPLVVLAVSLLASLVPASAASHAEPMSALREQ